MSNEVMDDCIAKQDFKHFSISPGVVDERYGAFAPEWRFTRDQIPLPFDLMGGKAWFHNLQTSQTISAGAGLDKRQATLDSIIAGDLSEEQPAPAILFECVFVLHIIHESFMSIYNFNFYFWSRLS